MSVKNYPTRMHEVLDIMAQPVSWAPGLVLRGAGFKTKEYYMKD